ncbi:hypothetical protein RRG08_033937 [Elysia crispata]|uniref:G-protein coupled receptors family 3 profile domain-containing protein n=1 Tax=Elysia crispata TaxID=231223 RepID=A0AAE0YBH7_9GAST|nr:hypothetical protein RRG08_033937 [Elysia crispata]
MAFAFPNAAAKLCYRFSSVIFIGSLGPSVVFGYKGILLIFGIFLACETQSVRLKQVNNSRFVGMSMLRADGGSIERTKSQAAGGGKLAFM